MLVFNNKRIYLTQMRFEKDGILASAGLAAAAFGPFAFVMGLGIGMNGIDHPTPTENKVEFVIPYTDLEIAKCIGNQTLQLTIKGEQHNLRVEDCSQHRMRP
jgi:hypothetical protein